ncbi:predicted protein [Uncinocarpus reesii 1704]|uniref:Uncharacterized protein n=1 Tax=Uncinocarpus reesii (strain UAMH 1704) TaxID=336963 RepID=C4JPM0_UNCRE|nr:uncharacterized protein UREG_03192 [Uncinocarpus reesii 1704]EEP78346.1 predicted protein [Uncinocarpus reesii 1704]
MVDDFAHDFKRHIKLKEDRIRELEAELEEANNIRAQLTSRIAWSGKEDDASWEQNREAKDALRILLAAKDPKNFICESPTSEPITSINYSILASAYRSTYQELSTLARAFWAVRNKLETTQKKASAWFRSFEQDSFQVNIKGEVITFRRAAACGISGEGERETETAIPQQRVLDNTRSPPPTLSTNSNRSITRSESEQDQELIPTQSQEPGFSPVHPPSLVHSSSGGPEFLSSRPVRKRNVENVAPIQVAASPVRTGSFTRPVTLKSEPSSRETQSNTPLNNCPDEMQHLTTRTVGVPTGIAEEALLAGETAQDHRQQSENRQRTSGTKRRQALQEVDPNLPVSPRQGAIASGKRRRFASRGAAAIPSVAEDGEPEGCSYEHQNGQGGGVAGPTNRFTVARRVQDLLDTPPPPRPVLLTTPRTALRAPSHARTPPAKSPNKRPSTIDRDGAGDQVLPEEEPLRCRPLHRLGLEHFRLNPEMNQGLDYATSPDTRTTPWR